MTRTWWRTPLARRVGGAATALVLLLALPDAAPSPVTASLVKLSTAKGVDGGHPDYVVWILALGSDARPGQPVLRSRADAIQLVGVNLRTGHGTVIGIPRDSFVPIPGFGSNRINAALTYGGPRLMGEAVANLVGVRPDYVFTTSFTGFRAMVQNIGGITVDSRLGFSDPNMIGRIEQGENRLNGFEALFFSRARYNLPRGDFDRSANQQEALRGILRQVRDREDRPGFMERALFSVLRNIETEVSPRELYRLAQALTEVKPRRLRGCVLNGSFGNVGGASIIFPDVAQARRLGDQARRDGRLDGPC